MSKQISAKEVRFSPQISYQESSILVDDVRDTWFLPQEFEDIYLSARKTIKEADPSSKESGLLFVQGRRTASYQATLFGVYKSCLEGHSVGKLHDDLQFWIGLGHSHRGLERAIVPAIRQESKYRVAQLRKSIIFVQRRCHENQFGPDRQAALIRMASLKLTTPSTNYARVMADADAIAAGSNLDEDLAMDMALQLSSKMLMYEVPTIVQKPVHRRYRRQNSRCNPAA